LELTSTDDIASQARGRAVKAKLLAARGDYEAAYHLAREAVELSDDSDDLFMQGQVLMALAEVLRLGGRDADAIPVLRQAVEVSERKVTSSRLMRLGRFSPVFTRARVPLAPGEPACLERDRS
jgi:tetratricopeptide (TPR) repeat protein